MSNKIKVKSSKKSTSKEGSKAPQKKSADNIFGSNKSNKSKSFKGSASSKTQKSFATKKT